jgi:hypothetical protein
VQEGGEGDASATPHDASASKPDGSVAPQPGDAAAPGVVPADPAHVDGGGSGPIVNRVFDATNLSKLIYTLPGTGMNTLEASENAYAVDPARGLLATRNFVYELSRYDVVVPTLTATADQMFFDRDGLLWYLVTAEGALKAQSIAH